MVDPLPMGIAVVPVELPGGGPETASNRPAGASERVQMKTCPYAPVRSPRDFWTASVIALR